MLLFLILISLVVIMLSAVSTMPFVIILLALSAVFLRSYWVFIVAFLLGFVFDLFFLRILGQTSLVFIIFTFLIFAYQKKFEIRTIPFVFFSSFIGSAIYLVLFGYDKVFIQTIVTSLLALLIFQSIKRFDRVNKES